MDISRVLLKNGIQEMIYDNKQDFKYSLEQALSIKLNESIKEAKNEFTKHLLDKDLQTSSSSSLNEFVSFIKNFDSGKYIFKDGSIINITESEKEAIKNLFESLNPENRSKMVQEIFETPASFKDHLNFAKEIRKLQ